MPRVIQDLIVFEGISYTLQAVVYGNGAHIVIRYKNGVGAVYEYEGMQTSTSRERQGARHAICTRLLLVGNASSLGLSRISQANNRKH